jgi:hypothetical protein
MSTVTVRVRNETREALRELSSHTGRSMPELLDQAVEELRRRSVLNGLAEDFAVLRNDPAAWREELEERGVWDGTLSDDLDGD